MKGVFWRTMQVSLPYYKNKKKIKTTHDAEVWKQGHKVRMLQDRTWFLRKLLWMYYQCTSKPWRRIVKNLSLAGVNSSFWGLVPDTFVHVAGSESIDRLFRSSLLNVEYTTISKVHFLGIKKIPLQNYSYFPKWCIFFEYCSKCILKRGELSFDLLGEYNFCMPFLMP